jgi:hypothetical protein
LMRGHGEQASSHMENTTAQCAQHTGHLITFYSPQLYGDKHAFI